VTEAMIDLVLEGHSPPSAEQVAERAGVSVASLFRYFETLDDLRLETTNRYFDRYAHLFEIDGIGEGTLDERIDRFVSTRVRLHETTEPMARLARMRAAEHADLADTLHRVRATRTDQVRHHFDAELSRMTPAERDDVAVTISTLTSFEAWDQLRHHHSRTQHQTRRAWKRALGRLLQTSTTPRRQS
jgi:AcrR family transcriptional regulator